MTMSSLQRKFTNVDLAGPTQKIAGTVDVDGPLLVWTAKNGEKKISIEADFINKLEWSQVPSGYELAVFKLGGNIVRLQGFNEHALSPLQEFAKLAGTDLEEIRISTTGWNWGDFQLKDNTLEFVVDGNMAFSVPYADISQSVKQGKRDISIELHQDDTARPEDESIVELRFYVPPEPIENEEDERDENTRAEAAFDSLYASLQEKSKVSGALDESIASFSDVLFVTPRGRFELEMFASFFKLHGKSYSYKILYKSIKRLFMLNRPDQHVIFVVSLNPAIRQGNTSYPYLLLKFSADEEIELKPNLSAKIIEEKYGGQLAAAMEGPVYDIVGRVFSALSQKKVIAPGSFESSESHSAVQCNLKANDGLLFPLEMSFFFVNKPPMYLRYDDIASLEFARMEKSSGAQSRTFDLIVNMRRGDVHHVFTGIDREEYRFLYDFLRSKRINIINARPIDEDETVEESYSRHGRRRRTVIQPDQMALDQEEEDDEDEDEDFHGQEDSDEDISDEYEERSQASGSDHAPVSDDDDGEEEESEEEAKDDARASSSSKKRKARPKSGKAEASKRESVMNSVNNQ